MLSTREDTVVKGLDCAWAGRARITVALVPLPHWDAWAVPVPILGLCRLVLIVPARTQRGAKSHFVLCQALDHDRWNTRILTIRRAGVLAVGVRKAGHGLQCLLHCLVLVGLSSYDSGAAQLKFRRLKPQLKPGQRRDV